jgi:hypothetical protein
MFTARGLPPLEGALTTLPRLRRERVFGGGREGGSSGGGSSTSGGGSARGGLRRDDDLRRPVRGSLYGKGSGELGTALPPVAI